MRIGITGHQKLRHSSDWDWVSQEVGRILESVDHPLIGISSLAAGADQLFANVILQKGGVLEAVIPFAEYENMFEETEARDLFRALLSAASRVEVLVKTGSAEEAYLRAGKRVVDLAEVVLAIWDGKPAAGLGGTADVVRYARDKQAKLIHLNPGTHEVIVSE
jgi:hypothetical protein